MRVYVLVLFYFWRLSKIIFGLNSINHVVSIFVSCWLSLVVIFLLNSHIYYRPLSSILSCPRQDNSDYLAGVLFDGIQAEQRTVSGGGAAVYAE